MQSIKEWQDQINLANKSIHDLNVDVRNLEMYLAESYNKPGMDIKHLVSEQNSITDCLKSFNQNVGYIGFKTIKDIAMTPIRRRNSKHNKPSWMSPIMYFKTVSVIKDVGSKQAQCPGCKESFKVPKSKGYYSFLYMVHMIEECEAYKRLDLITECKECSYLFPNRKSYMNHESHVHSKRPKWMLPNMFRKRHWKTGVLTTVQCLGCQKTLERRNTVYTVSATVHIIDECDGYKSLGLFKQCKVCKCKFVNRLAISKHKCHELS